MTSEQNPAGGVAVRVEADVSDKYRRWNFDADDNGLLVCRGEHESNEHCEAHMERLSTHEALAIINELRAECLRWSAVRAAVVANDQAHAPA